tara:strand:- start:210 stop:1388 length:1179 start_codon:yes stop_codon:yes gene_type:complete
MAVDIGRALSGLGAAFKNEMPAFIQQTRQEDALALEQSEFERNRLLQDEALAEKRRKTMFQDAAAASSLLDSGDYRGIADLMEDRITILGPTGADTNHSNEKRTLALRASVGDQRAIGELKRLIANEVGIGYSTGMITRPVRDKGVELNGRLVNPYTGEPMGLENPDGYIDPKERSDVLKEIRAGVRATDKGIDEVTTAYNKVTGLEAEMRKGSRTAINAGIMSVARLISPGVVTDADANAIAGGASTASALLQAIEAEGMDVTQIMSVLDPRNPSTFDVDALMSVARSVTAAGLPTMLGSYADLQARAEGYQASSTMINSFFNPKSGRMTAINKIMEQVRQGADNTSTDQSLSGGAARVYANEAEAQAAGGRGEFVTGDTITINGVFHTAQ